MTNEEKSKAYDRIVEYLWCMCRSDNLFGATLAAVIIQKLKIEGPNGEKPEDA